MPPPELIAHRGYASRYPENTLAAVAAAIDAGAQYVEIDVQLSADAAPLLFHDRSLERMCGVAGAVHEYTLAELNAFSCHDPGRFGGRFRGEGLALLVAFGQLLLQHPRVHAFVEIKRVALERFGNERVLARVLEALHPVLARVTLISFSIPFLSATRHAVPIALGAVFNTWKERETAEVRDLEPEYVFCDIDGLPSHGRLVHERAHTVVYEVADPKVALALAERGVAFVETFEIAGMLQALGADVNSRTGQA